MRIEPRSVPITIIIACKNEEKNLKRCLDSVIPATRVVVVDSCSSDSSVAIAIAFGAEVVQFSYSGGYPKKRQWALSNLVRTSTWVAFLDADERLTEPLWHEVKRVVADDYKYDALTVVKEFHFLGRRMRFGGFSHSAVFLLRWGRGNFEQLAATDCGLDMEVHERILVLGPVGQLKEVLLHDDWKGLGAYIDRHNRYSTWEAAVRSHYLQKGKWEDGGSSERLSGVQLLRRRLKAIAVRVPFEPVWWFVYHYLICLGVLEGRRGFEAARIRAGYIADVRAKIYEASILDRSSGSRFKT